MNISRYIFSTLFIILLLSTEQSNSQPVLLDQVAAVVGSEMIMQSDIENQILQYKAQGMQVKSNFRCELLQQMLEQKLMVNQAKLDSVQVSEATVALQMDARLNHFMSYFGSEKELEGYFGKSILQIKEDFHDLIKEQILMEEMEKNITGEIKITPSEVKEFYKSMPRDSIPFIDARMEVLQITKYPKYPEEAILKVKERLLDMRKRILEGSSFATQAVLYSQDPGSAKNGGEQGFKSKAELDPEYAKVAFGLKEGQISKIVESQLGYHIIQMIERKNDRVNTRHILLNPEVTAVALEEAKHTLDSIVRLIHRDSLKFEMAAIYFSEDKNSYMNGGLRVNPKSGTSYFELNDFTPEEYYVVKKLNVGDITEAFQTKDENGKPVLKILMIKSKSDPHPANLKEDYQFLQELALEDKKKNILHDWITEKQKTTSFYIDSSFDRCKLTEKGWVKAMK